MTASEQQPDDQVRDSDSPGAGENQTELAIDEFGVTLVGLSQKFRAFNNRVHHMSRDLSGMSLELSDVTDDIADVRDTTGMLKTSNTRIEIEVAKMRADISRLANAVEKLAAT